MTHNQSHKPQESLSSKTRKLSVVLCLGMLAGVLIWAKLRLVTDIPRSAYADPREVEVPDLQISDQNGDQLIDRQDGLIESESEGIEEDAIEEPELESD